MGGMFDDKQVVKANADTKWVGYIALTASKKLNNEYFALI